MTELTEVQGAVLDAWCKHRVVVVRACPGAGKTRVFVAALRKELGRDASSRQGVAALSFTNVAQEEIAHRLGARVSPPHFVGTLDSFLWRFVVVPFGHLVGVRRAGPRLVPAPLERTLPRPEFKYGAAHEKVSLFRCHLRQRLDGAVGVDIDTRDGNVSGDANQTTSVLAAKRRLWRNQGQLTHSDSHFVAAEVLRSPHASEVQRILAKRFRAILIDECQDTNSLMGSALLALLDGSPIRALVVGDPDQAIYGFGGGTKDLLDRAAGLPDAVARELNETHRCAQRVARVVSALSRRGATIEPRADALEGAALLLVHDHAHDRPRLDEISAALAARGISPAFGTTAVLARKGTTLERMTGARATSCPLSSSAAKHLARAAAALRDGEPRAAFMIASHVLGDLLVGGDGPLDDRLRAAQIDPRRWRRAVHAVLVEAARDRVAASWGAWRESVRRACEAQAAALGRPVALGASFKKGRGEDSSWSGAPPVASALTLGPISTLETIHSVKGQEFEHVVLYAPKPHAALAPCPSTEWWSEAPESEEREVAFVGASRAKLLLIVAVHEETFAALHAQRPDFVALFELHRAATPKPVPRRSARSRRGTPESS